MFWDGVVIPADTDIHEFAVVVRVFASFCHVTGRLSPVRFKDLCGGGSSFNVAGGKTSIDWIEGGGRGCVWIEGPGERRIAGSRFSPSGGGQTP